MVLTCDGPDNGAMDIEAILNHDPRITDLTFDPSKFIETCETVHIHVEAEDPDGDRNVTYVWNLIDAPANAQYELDLVDAQTARFVSLSEGNYTFVVAVCDAFELCGILVFPVHVQANEGLRNDACL